MIPSVSPIADVPTIQAAAPSQPAVPVQAVQPAEKLLMPAGIPQTPASAAAVDIIA